MRLFIIMGKSGTGKDTLLAKIKDDCPDIQTIIPYTTRPKRSNERDGDPYNFITPEHLQKLLERDELIECRTFNYATVSAGVAYATPKLNLDSDKDYVLVTTPDAYEKIKAYYDIQGHTAPDHEITVIPVYLMLDPYTRLSRCYERECKNDAISPDSCDDHRFQEVIKRFLSDEVKFRPFEQDMHQFENLIVINAALPPDIVYEQFRTLAELEPDNERVSE